MAMKMKSMSKKPVMKAVLKKAQMKATKAAAKSMAMKAMKKAPMSMVMKKTPMKSKKSMKGMKSSPMKSMKTVKKSGNKNLTRTKSGTKNLTRTKSMKLKITHTQNSILVQKDHTGYCSCHDRKCLYGRVTIPPNEPRVCMTRFIANTSSFFHLDCFFKNICRWEICGSSAEDDNGRRLSGIMGKEWNSSSGQVARSSSNPYGFCRETARNFKLGDLKLVFREDITNTGFSLSFHKALKVLDPMIREYNTYLTKRESYKGEYLPQSGNLFTRKNIAGFAYLPKKGQDSIVSGKEVRGILDNVLTLSSAEDMDSCFKDSDEGSQVVDSEAQTDYAEFDSENRRLSLSGMGKDFSTLKQALFPKSKSNDSFRKSNPQSKSISRSFPGTPKKSPNRLGPRSNSVALKSLGNANSLEGSKKAMKVTTRTSMRPMMSKQATSLSKAKTTKLASALLKTALTSSILTASATKKSASIGKKNSALLPRQSTTNSNAKNRGNKSRGKSRTAEVRVEPMRRRPRKYPKSSAPKKVPVSYENNKSNQTSTRNFGDIIPYTVVKTQHVDERKNEPGVIVKVLQKKGGPPPTSKGIRRVSSMNTVENAENANNINNAINNDISGMSDVDMSNLFTVSEYVKNNVGNIRDSRTTVASEAAALFDHNLLDDLEKAEEQKKSLLASTSIDPKPIMIAMAKPMARKPGNTASRLETAIGKPSGSQVMRMRGRPPKAKEDTNVIKRAKGRPLIHGNFSKFKVKPPPMKPGRPMKVQNAVRQTTPMQETGGETSSMKGKSALPVSPKTTPTKEAVHGLGYSCSEKIC